MPAIELYNTPLFRDSNILHYYRFEGNSNDSKGSVNGTDVGVSYGSSYGYFNQGANFNGSARTYFSGHTISASTPFSISFWMKSSTADLCSIFSDGVGFDGDHAGVYIWNCDSSGKFVFQLRNGISDEQSNIGATTNVFNGNWHHIVCTHTGDTSTNGQKIYIDGTLDAQITSAFDVVAPSGSNFYIASARYDSNLYNYNGYIDDFAVFNRVLTATEISKLYTGNWANNLFFFNAI